MCIRDSRFTDLVDELRRVDPELATRLDLQNPARVLRALEVFRATGVPLSAWQQAPTDPPRFAYAWRVLTPPDADHRRAIEARTHEMLRNGLVEETRALLARGVTPDAVVMRTIGYRETVAALASGGPIQLDDLAQAISLSTWQYARRQRTFFRRLF